MSSRFFLKKFKGPKERDEKLPYTLLELIPGETSKDRYQALRESNLITVNKADIKTGRFKGIPQGSGLSAVLSNIYLIDFDKKMFAKSIDEDFTYRRYCDDILIIWKTEHATELKNFAINLIADEYYLTIQDKKVEVIDFKPNSKGKIRAFKRDKTAPQRPAMTIAQNEKKFYKSLQYLGFEFNGQMSYIRSSSLSRYFRKMKARIVKTISMAYGRSGKSNKVFLDQIFERYSHLGKRNFVTYAYNASKEKYRTGHKENEGLNSPAIKKQLSRHFSILRNAIEVKDRLRITAKLKRNKIVDKKQTRK